MYECLDDRSRERRQRIAQRHTRMCERAGIDQDTVDPIHGLLSPVDQRALVIRLETLELRPGRLCEPEKHRVDLVERDRAVDLGLPRAEQIQVRAVENQDAERTGHDTPPDVGRRPRILAASPGIVTSRRATR
jgi:hypothetical protein